MTNKDDFDALQQLVADMAVELSVLRGTIDSWNIGNISNVSSSSSGSGSWSRSRRELWHNDSLASIYEFPQVNNRPVPVWGSSNKGVPVPTKKPGESLQPVKNNGLQYVTPGTYAVNQRYVLPGSGEPDAYGNSRPKYYMNAWYSPTAVIKGKQPYLSSGYTSQGVMYNSGDAAWMMSATVLVFFMTMPGLAIYYSGMVRKKNVLSFVMQVFSICCWVTVWWMIFGYSLAWTPVYPNNHVNELYGNADRLWLRGMTLRTFHAVAPTIPESVFCLFQLMYAICTHALICGSVADRLKYVPMTVFMALWHLCVYCPMVHSNWHPQGFLKMFGVLDFAGGNVVHVASGVSGLAVVLVIGRRRGYGKKEFKSSSIAMTCVGMAMMWLAWFGLTAGCAFGANFNTGYAMLATQIAASVGALSWWLTEWAVTREPTVVGFISGALAGLVCITPGSGCVDMTGAFFIGLFAGPLCYGGSLLKRFFGFDDALDAFGVHAIGGMVGGIATGFFATDQVVMTPQGGLLEGTSVQGVYYSGFHHGGAQLAAQVCGVLFAIGWPFFWSYLIAWVLEKTIGLRVSREVEKVGLDWAIHGETLSRRKRRGDKMHEQGGEEEGDEGEGAEGDDDGGEEAHLV